MIQTGEFPRKRRKVGNYVVLTQRGRCGEEAGGGCWFSKTATASVVAVSRPLDRLLEFEYPKRPASKVQPSFERIVPRARNRAAEHV